PLADTWRLKGGIGNEVDQNRLLNLHETNAYLLDSLSLQTTITQLPFFTQLEGNVTRDLKFKGGARFQDIENALYFIPSSTDSSRFFLRYGQGELTIFEYFMGLEWSPDPSFQLSGKYSIFENNASTEIEPWYRPNASYHFSLRKSFGKLAVGSDLRGVMGLRAPTSTEEVMDLPAIVDLGVHVNYLVNDQLSVFARGNNLLNKEYEYYYLYPSRALTAKVGLSYRF
ncbi:MAG: hypothetical protein AAFN93_29765, partial [Bacteroidota bacterium]